MKTTLKRGIGRSAKSNGNGNAVFPPGPISTITRYRQPPPPERSGMAMLGRILIGTVLAVLSLALAGAGGAYLFFHESIDDVRASTPEMKELEKEGLEPNPLPNQPTVALVVGYDLRHGEDPRYSRSDTLMMVRADPRTESISLLSFPRDLLVDVYCPGSPTVYAQINSAYSRCGPKGTLKTVHELTNVPINYMIRVNFRGFREVVDEVGGIWLDIDRRYYNHNDGRSSTNFSDIDLQPGYQRLGGAAALSFVRFRHTDDDYHRVARQQQFVRAFKDQIAKHVDLFDLPGIIRVITSNVEVAGRVDEKTILEYANLARTLPAGHLFQVKIEGVSGYAELTAPAGSVQTAVEQFVNPDVTLAKVANNSALGKKAPKPKAPAPKDTTIVVLNGNGVPGSAATANALLAERGYITLLPPGNVSADAPKQDYFHSQVFYDPSQKGAEAAAKALKRLAEPADVAPIPKDPALRALDPDAMLVFVAGQTFHNTIGETQQAEAPKREAPDVRYDATSGRDLIDDYKGKVPFPLMVPTILESNSVPDPVYGDTPIRMYQINKDHKAIRMVFRNGANEYWGVQETDWKDAPALAKPTFTQTIKGRTYDMYYSGKHLHMIVLRQGDARYWVVNTLLDKLSNETMIAIAKGLKPLAAAK